MAATLSCHISGRSASASGTGPQSEISPATPDIVRKLAQQPEIRGADGSCCTAKFTAVAVLEPEVTGCGKRDSDELSSAPSQSALGIPDKVESVECNSMASSVKALSQTLRGGPAMMEGGESNSVPSSDQEESRSVPEDLGKLDCAVSTQEFSTLPACDSGRIAQQGDEGLASDSDSSANDPASTPDKVEPSPRRWRKKSTKGVPRFKVVKDKILKPKVTPKESTPNTKIQKKKLQKDSIEHVGRSTSNAVRRKLDLDSSENKVCFSRVTLMGNLRCLAKSRGLKDDPCARMTKRGKKRKFGIFKHQECGQLAMVPYQSTQTNVSSSALVPLMGFTEHAIVCKGRVQKLHAKVLGLDEETLQVYDVLRKWDESDSESFEGFDIGSGPKWDARRRILEQCVDVFIAAMDDLLGPRKFSQWGGSIIDSVVGTFLTQNVTDNLSSNAFMNLAAKFPPSKTCRKAGECSNVPLFNGFEETLNSEKEDGYDEEIKGQYGPEYRTKIDSFISIMKQEDISALDKEQLMNMVKDKSGNPVCTEKTLKRFIATQNLKDTSEWDNLRKEAYQKGYNSNSGAKINDAVDWESVLHAPIQEVAKCIEGRGQHYLMSCRIQAFLARIAKDHGSFDLDWLRYVPRESAKNYLLSIHGLGDKSVDCIRLLSLRHKAFPVDVNVARIVTRLGWVQLQPLQDSAEFHLVHLYPLMRDVQSYLWPRLCTIDKEKLYELHYHMITFGKVVCTKTNPNCNACPFSAKCKYYISTHGKLYLPPAEAHGHESGNEETSMDISGKLHLSNDDCMPSLQQMSQHQIEICRTAEKQPIHNCEPIIEVPPSPEHEYEGPDELEESYEDDPCDLEDIVPEGVEYDARIDLTSSNHMVNNHSWTPNYGKDLVLINPQGIVGRHKKLKNIGHLRTEHDAYVLPDDHLIIDGHFEDRVPEDPNPYLLVVVSCPDDYTVKGTILIPCRTATGGNFPLNGSYFQEHEVFADHQTSNFPVSVPRSCLWNLKRCTVYFGSSIHSITKGQTRQDIQDCYKKGYICVRGFDRATRQPKRICGTLHATNIEKKEGSKESPAKRGKASPKARKDEEPSSSAN